MQWFRLRNPARALRPCVSVAAAVLMLSAGMAACSVAADDRPAPQKTPPDVTKPIAALRSFLRFLAAEKVDKAYKLVAPSSRKNGDAVVTGVPLDFASFRREFGKVQSTARFQEYRLGKRRWENPKRLRVWVTLIGPGLSRDNDEAVMVLENGRWYVADPIHIIR